MAKPTARTSAPKKKAARPVPASALKALGSIVAIPPSPDEALLETIPVPADAGMADSFVVRFSCPEFTSLCPATGQPDFAHFVIDFVPELAMVESKSLKLFMSSFRNHASFHEAVTAMVAARLWDAMHPQWLRVSGFWFPRGGIPIDVFWEAGSRPVNAPGTEIPIYRAR